MTKSEFSAVRAMTALDFQNKLHTGVKTPTPENHFIIRPTKHMETEMEIPDMSVEAAKIKLSRRDVQVASNYSAATSTAL